MEHTNEEGNIITSNKESQQIYSTIQLTESNDINTYSFLEEKEIYKFYHFPKYYDIAFRRCMKTDIEFFQKCFQQYSDINVKRILEPACGPGMLLEELTRYGYYTFGYDLSEAMVFYSAERLKKAGLLPEKSNVMVGDMKNIEFDTKFDGAIICINSLGYLTREEDIISHFKSMGNSLKKGGIYIIELSCKCDDLKNERKIDDIWYAKEGDIELKLSWVINRYDVEHRIRYVDFQMFVNDNNKKWVVEEAHELRLWLFDEFKNFVIIGGFKLLGIYNQKYELISENIPITGELGALFFILKKE
ncbi:MAG: class I SAM-dependent methyltransferase [Promethearchaeota archaeon]